MDLPYRIFRPLSRRRMCFFEKGVLGCSDLREIQIRAQHSICRADYLLQLAGHSWFLYLNRRIQVSRVKSDPASRYDPSKTFYFFAKEITYCKTDLESYSRTDGYECLDVC